MKKKLEELLREMDSYDWDSVPNIFDGFFSCVIQGRFDEYKKDKSEVFKKCLEKIDIEFSGSVLDLCCGPVSFGIIYDNVVGYDIKPQFIKELRKNRIKGIIGDIRDMPFEDKSFDYVICSFPPWKIFTKQNYNITKFTDDCIKIARKKVIIKSPPFVEHLPEKYKERIENISSMSVVYNLMEPKVF